MLPAFDNGAIDAAVIAEPLATLAERDGSAVRVMGNDAIDPNQEMATIMYGGPFIKQHRDLAQRFMMAYLRAVRFYNDALSDGHLRGRTANDVVAVVAEATHAKDPSVFRQMTANAVDPDGRINVTSLREDLEFFKTQGLINTPKVRVEDAVDPSFAAAAVKTLGEYRPNKG
jgi:NitT/TauT family transport system substrate-binding protein